MTLTLESFVGIDQAYRDLGLEPGTSFQTVKWHYRRIARANHTDLHPEKRDEEFGSRKEAYEAISKWVKFRSEEVSSAHYPLWEFLGRLGLDLELMLTEAVPVALRMVNLGLAVGDQQPLHSSQLARLAWEYVTREDIPLRERRPLMDWLSAGLLRDMQIAWNEIEEVIDLDVVRREAAQQLQSIVQDIPHVSLVTKSDDRLWVEIEQDAGNPEHYVEVLSGVYRWKRPALVHQVVGGVGEIIRGSLEAYRRGLIVSLKRFLNQGELYKEFKRECYQGEIASRTVIPESPYIEIKGVSHIQSPTALVGAVPSLDRIAHVSRGSSRVLRNGRYRDLTGTG